ncbi:MAG: hypothetical protein ACR2IE_20695 [Candidatus Sumerlaeaceae bacterium]
MPSDTSNPTPAAAAPPDAPLPGLPGLPPASSSLAPPPQQQLPSDRISQPDVAKVQRRKEVEDALSVVREAFYKQDWQAAKTALEAAQQVDANAPQLQVYQNLLARKLAEQAGQTGPALRTPRPGYGPIESVPLASPAPARAASPVATAPAVVKATAATAAPPEVASKTPRKKALLALICAAVAVGIGWTLYRYFTSRVKSEPEAPFAGVAPAGLSSGMLPEIQPLSSRTPAGPPASLMFQDVSDKPTLVDEQATLIEDHATLMEADDDGMAAFGSARPRPAVDDHPQDADSMAQAIAKNLAMIKPQVPEATPQFELFGGAMSSDATNYADGAPAVDAPSVSAASFAAPPKPQGSAPMGEPVKSPAPSASSEMVSFEDLGISFGPSEPAAAPTPPAPAPALGAAAPQLTAPPPASKAPEPTPAPAAAQVEPSAGPADSPIRLDDLTVATPPKAVPVAPLPSKPLSGEGAIDLQEVLFGKPVEMPSISVSPSPVPNPPVQSQEPHPVQLPSLDDFNNAPAIPPKPAPSQEDTYGAYGDTFHSQDTIGLGSATAAEDSLKLDGTVGFSTTSKNPAPVDPALASTKTSVNSAPAPQESYYAASPKGGSQLDERSEKMFREQYDRAQKAMNDRNWRQAVHYLSIAAAIHPDNEQVRDQLKEARAEKRKQEAGV